MTANNKYQEALKKEGMKNTRHRTSILHLLEHSKEPLTAEDIFIFLKNKSNSICLSTVYRTLEKLTAINLLMKSNITNDGKARYALNDHDHKHYIVCTKCNKLISIDDCPMEEFTKVLKKQMDFDVTGHKLEIYGYCHDCKV